MRISLTKAVKDLYIENCETLLKEIEGTKTRKDTPCSGIGRITLFKKPLPRGVYRLNAILIAFSAQTEQKNILKFVWNYKRPQMAKEILKTKNKAGVIPVPDLKFYCKAIVIETVWYW